MHTITKLKNVQGKNWTLKDIAFGLETISKTKNKESLILTYVED